MTLRFTILGCGSSMGVPRVALGWGACDPNNPKNRRRRCSVLVERLAAEGACTRILIDCTPDLREQLLDAQVDHLDAVLLTHGHADHTHGIDDLRPFFVRSGRPLAVYFDPDTARSVRRRFGYCFETPAGGSYPPTLTGHEIAPLKSVRIEGEGGPIDVLPFIQHHGDINSIGYRFGSAAYSADLKSLPAESAEVLVGLDLWIVDALRHAPHPSHMNVAEALDWIGRLKPGRAVLSNLHSDLDYEALRTSLPDTIEPGYDGMQIELK